MGITDTVNMLEYVDGLLKTIEVVLIFCLKLIYCFEFLTVYSGANGVVDFLK